MDNKSYYKKRFILLIGGSIILVLSCYHLAIKKTISEYRILTENNNQISQMKNAPGLLFTLEKRLQSLKKSILTGRITEEEYQVHVLERVTACLDSSSVIIAEMPRLFSEDGENYIKLTQPVILQGGFNDFVTFLGKISKNRSLGKIISVDIYLLKDSKSRQNTLRMKLFFQKIIDKQVV